MQDWLRSASEQDAEAIAGLLPHLGYKASVEQVQRRLAELLPNPSCAVFLYETSGRVVGLCLVSSVKHLASAGYAEVLELAVHSEFQRKGVGRKLVQRAQAWSLAQGHSRVRLRSGVHREEAHRFYERLGYSKSRASYAFELALEPVAPNPALERTPLSRPRNAEADHALRGQPKAAAQLER